MLYEIFLIIWQIHKLGLKFGLYLSYGDMTDDSHLEQDAQQLANWGVDMVTMDANLTSGSEPSILNKGNSLEIVCSNWICKFYE